MFNWCHDAVGTLLGRGENAPNGAPVRNNLQDVVPTPNRGPPTAIPSARSNVRSRYATNIPSQTRATPGRRTSHSQRRGVSRQTNRKSTSPRVQSPAILNSNLTPPHQYNLRTRDSQSTYRSLLHHLALHF